jgi:hypothetical protein
MCDPCHHAREVEPSRRHLLKLLAAAATAAIAGCQVAPTSELPDAYKDHLVSESRGGPMRIERNQIVIPPETKPTQTEFGSILPRSAWTSLPLTLRKGKSMDGVNKITIHHSGDGKPFTATAAADIIRHLQIVQQAHLKRGMADIAYHFAIDPTGRVWQLRWLQYQGEHVRPGKNGASNNAHNIGIVLLGDFNLQRLPAPQRDRAFDLVRLLRGSSKYNLPAKAVFTHGELVGTDCPGKYLESIITDARRRGQL